MKASDEIPPAPTRGEVERQLLDLAEGRVTRETAADWAGQWVYADARVDDGVVWDALVTLTGADMISTDRPYLYDADDFRHWLERLRTGRERRE
jgi:hypothetical protein